MPNGTLSKVLFQHHPYQVSEVLMLPFREGLGKDISDLVISRNILQLHRSSLNLFSDEVVPDLNVLRPTVKHQILRELNATLIIAIDYSQSKLPTKQPHQ